MVKRALLSTHKIVPLAYPPSYFRFKTGNPNLGVFTGLVPYGKELLEGIDYVWIGRGKTPIKELLEKISSCGYGISLWGKKGNNYYGDPGKTKLYSACGLPVLMTDNTPYAKIIKETMAGVIVDYTKESVNKGVKELIFNHAFYKRNVKLTWKYINADILFGNKDFLGE